MKRHTSFKSLKKAGSAPSSTPPTAARAEEKIMAFFAAVKESLRPEDKSASKTDE
jgi:hypothetical protein